MIAPVRPITIEDVEAAGERIAGTVLRTPLVRLDLGPNGPDIRLKLENLQPTNADSRHPVRGGGDRDRAANQARPHAGARRRNRPGFL